MNNLMNIFLTCILSLPLLVFIYLYKQTRPKYYGILVGGILLLGYSAAVFYSLSDVKAHIAKLYVRATNLSQSDKEAYEVIGKKLELWLYVLPVAVGAIGANLITDFIKKKKPANQMGSKIT